ncbi:MAG: RNA polymerase sigma factor [Steroidobacteraceae bacterium]
MVARLAAGQGRRLRQFLGRRVRNAADIPDLVQEVFLRLLRVPRHESIRSPEAYLMTIARHVAQQHRLQADPKNSLNLEDALADLRSCSGADPALEVTAEQCRDALEETLQHMAPKVQATFLLHRRDGLTIDQVSERLGISRPMAKKYLVKALVQFRKRLKEGE